MITIQQNVKNALGDIRAHELVVSKPLLPKIVFGVISFAVLISAIFDTSSSSSDHLGEILIFALLIPYLVYVYADYLWDTKNDFSQRTFSSVMAVGSHGIQKTESFDYIARVVFRRRRQGFSDHRQELWIEFRRPSKMGNQLVASVLDSDEIDLASYAQSVSERIGVPFQRFGK